MSLRYRNLANAFSGPQFNSESGSGPSVSPIFQPNGPSAFSSPSGSRPASIEVFLIFKTKNNLIKKCAFIYP